MENLNFFKVFIKLFFVIKMIVAVYHLLHLHKSYLKVCECQFYCWEWTPVDNLSVLWVVWCTYGWVIRWSPNRQLYAGSGELAVWYQRGKEDGRCGVMPVSSWASVSAGCQRAMGGCGLAKVGFILGPGRAEHGRLHTDLVNIPL